MPIEPARWEDGRPMLLGGLRRHHAYADAARDIPAQWREFAATLPLPGQRGAVTYGVVCGSSPERGTFEYMCAAEVAALDALPAGTGRMRVPAQRYAVFVHDAGIATIRATWDAIWHDWLPRSGQRAANTPDFERYDERWDARAGDGVVEIWFPVAVEGQEAWTGGAPARDA